jgi:hypothetical protein
MSSLFEMIFPEESKQLQTCIYCNQTSTWSGWSSLCNRRCYYGICDLLDLYNNDDAAVADPRLVAYFTKHPLPTHSFSSEKILAYIKGK